MKLSEFLLDVRDTLDDPNGNKFLDAALLRMADAQVRSMFRQQALVDDNWHNCDVNVSKESFRQIGLNLWQYPLRSWCDKILAVWKRNRSSAVSDHESPEMVLDAAGGIAADQDLVLVHSSNVQRDRAGFQVLGQTVLRLVNFAEVFDAKVQVAKIPAKLTKGTVDRESGDSKFFYLQSEATTTAAMGLHELEFGGYRNARFTFNSSLDTGGQDVLSGVVATCVHSETEVFTSPTSGKNVRVFLDADLPRALKVGDTYEMLVEIPDADARYHVLKVARMGFVKQRSPTGLQSIARELAEEEVSWRNHISPRQTQEPKFWRTAEDAAFAERRRQDFDSGTAGVGMYLEP